MIALFEAYKAGLFKKHNLIPNIIAGMIVAVVALPLAMAFAIASGVKPEQGLYTAIVAGLMVGIFGGSRVQVAGPTGAFIIILADITARHGIDGLQIASLMAGIILVCMGIIKIGNIIKFIPDPVIVGFTSGIGIIIFVSECKDFFGLPEHLISGHYFHEKSLAIINALPHLNHNTAALAGLSLLLTIFSSRLIKRIPGPLLAMVVATSLNSIFHFEGVATIGSAFGAIPNQLPGFHLPDITILRVVELMGAAFTIALLASIEALLSAVVADGMTSTKHNSNQELIGQGLANIFAPLFGGFASTGAIARTATNIRNGGNSPLASIIHSITLILVILLLAPLAAYIPLCTLAAILFVVAYNMSDFHHFFSLLKHAPRNDVLVLLITFFLTIFTDLVVAVNVGVILSIFLFVQRMSQSVSIEEHTDKDLQHELKAHGLKLLPKGILVYSINGPFFFGTTELLEQTLLNENIAPEVIIFRLKQVPFMDITGLQTFHEIIKEFQQRKTKVYVCEANQRVAYKLSKIGLFKSIAGQKSFDTLKDVLGICLGKRKDKE